ncbi:MAG: hypothetical protein PF637_11685 [Spirochaetes bacterium]|jgi:hypothetical protein|nr:hypothetical protein [Spirochaetota bacterium]
MNSAIAVLFDEQQRLKRVEKMYDAKIAELPKGSLQKKKRASRYFYYHAVSLSNGKYRWKYLGNDLSPDVQELESLIQKRKQFEIKRRKAKNELKKISQLLGRQ